MANIFLVDPVFSGNASPFTFTTKSFAGTDIFKVEDLPDIDVLLISHDHYDHLDYKTVVELIPKTKLVCTSLGVAIAFTILGF
jgi:L-ascorbate metabolism protein UlaG (beta-lactamase superfamily)